MGGGSTILRSSTLIARSLNSTPTQTTIPARRPSRRVIVEQNSTMVRSWGLSAACSNGSAVSKSRSVIMIAIGSTPSSSASGYVAVQRC